MVEPVSVFAVTSGASGRLPAVYETVLPLTTLPSPPLFPVASVTASAPPSSTAKAAATMTTIRRLDLNTSGSLRAGAFRWEPPGQRTPTRGSKYLLCPIRVGDGAAGRNRVGNAGQL